ncbi:putative clathrin assembly protein At5g57200 isoform X2 [Magnolia sinica]|uniref:putative clathrin assembly protein At5g57200 isoform X2 n=1 Tax=Magnolia sinica TaxID=86752 RepID=UPI002659BC0C|nr:putative clathrin assembly protein At5g57200 isoform X2 [Magnolia sinica]XP_058088387.1 putative clathrin assembly protein At5g57200 isoform X2 [Magnolia sinica]
MCIDQLHYLQVGLERNVMNKGPPVLSMEESCAKEIQEPPQLNIEPALQPPMPAADTGDLLGLNEINPDTAVIEESNAMALAIVPPAFSNPNYMPGVVSREERFIWFGNLSNKP